MSESSPYESLCSVNGRRRPWQRNTHCLLHKVGFCRRSARSRFRHCVVTHCDVIQKLRYTSSRVGQLIIMAGTFVLLCDHFVLDGGTSRKVRLKWRKRVFGLWICCLRKLGLGCEGHFASRKAFRLGSVPIIRISGNSWKCASSYPSSLQCFLFFICAQRRMGR